MITTRWAPRTRRFFAGALVLSIAIHLFGGALWARATHAIAQIMRRLPEQHQPERDVATSDAITLEKRTVPRPAQASRKQPRVQPATPHIAVAPKSAVRRPLPKRDRPVPAAQPEIAHRTTHAPLHAPKPDVAKAPGAGTTAARQAALSASQLAQLNAQFSKTIASTRTDLATIQKQTEQRPVATKRYPMQFAGIQANLQRGQGYIEPISTGQRIGATVSYHTHYTYMWPDGHIEDDDIPWPFRFPVQRDLFALHQHLIPLQLPPPGFHLTRPLKPFLAHFLQSAR